MILTRSPFYYNVTLTQFSTSVDFEIKVGTGTLSTITPLSTYSITKTIPTPTTTNTWIDISPYIREHYTYTPFSFTGVTANEIRFSPSKQVLLAQVTASFNDTIGSTQADQGNKYISVDGYGNYLEGQNHEPTKKILLSHNEYKADYRGYFIVPLRVASGDANPTINGVAVPLAFSDGATNYVKYIVVCVFNYTDLITVAFAGETITIEPVEECKYDVNQIQFINKFGVFELMHSYKVKKDSISIDSEKFKNNYTNGTSYNTTKHQLQRFNAMGNRKTNVETGFMNEEYNQTIEELLLSEYVWMNGKPVNIDTSSLDFKTRIVDKLISYSLDFEYAYDEINNV